MFKVTAIVSHYQQIRHMSKHWFYFKIKFILIDIFESL